MHLTAVGPDRPPATIEFAPRLTVIYGASETGKSYVIEALNFMLGGSSLRDLPEAAGYRSMMLGIELDDGEVVTLSRELRGGRISVFEDDVRSTPDRKADRQLLGQHKKDNPDNISYFLLDRLGIADAKLRKNKNNVVQAMSFRNIAHLVLVDEERMDSRVSPIESGLPMTKTAEHSAFKLLLEGVDDSGLPQGEDPAEFRRINRGQVEVLDRAIGQVRAELEDAPELNECVDVRARVDAAIRQASNSMTDSLARRAHLVEERVEQQNQRQLEQERVNETTVLLNRFNLLDAQYATDLARLQLVKETGTLLGYFDADACVFCGATVKHQQREHAVYETVRLSESVDAESAKNEALKRDLSLTLGAMQQELELAQSRLLSLDTDVKANIRQIAQVEDALRPAQADLEQLITRRSQIERWMELWTRVADLEQLLASVAQEQPSAVERVSHGVTTTTQRAFSGTLRSVLTQWQVPGGAEALFTFADAPEIMVEHRRREDRGKGMRSVLHAGFSIALSEYCTQRDLPHPGFVALDTPVLTYRDAEHAEGGSETIDTTEEELLSASVAQAFYDYLANKHPGQTIVLENQTPPVVDAPACKVVYFTGNAKTGRPGFYPLD
ncbi:AAA family ATPase [Rhodococcus erythropolis]|uniref:AAA family ATPase n=1 Tax=Rhodococcus erythropolis TaxID=1833 RepID=UPI00130E6F52|nr:AAA family ATPase [Rhodococcus erythropolis]